VVSGLRHALMSASLHWQDGLGNWPQRFCRPTFPRLFRLIWIDPRPQGRLPVECQGGEGIS
jgi:hypothetical protein